MEEEMPIQETSSLPEGQLILERLQVIREEMAGLVVISAQIAEYLRGPTPDTEPAASECREGWFGYVQDGLDELARNLSLATLYVRYIGNAFWDIDAPVPNVKGHN